VLDSMLALSETFSPVVRGRGLTACEVTGV